MITAPVISPTGVTAPTYAEILSQLQDAMRSIYGSDIYIEPDSQDGQFLAIMAAALHDNNDAVIAAYNAFSPLTAQGVGLSTVVKINGIRRLVPSNSQAVVSVVGVTGTIINNGQIADPVGNRWALPASVVIPDAGTIDVTATAVDPGAIPASPGTLTSIVTPTRGWQTVTNAAAAIPGAPVEGDAGLRQRQSHSTAIPALTVVDAMLGAIENLTAVIRAMIYENPTDATDSNGIPEHSICAVVQGGDLTEIAETIALYKTPGTGTFGSTSETVLDPKGIPITIHFDELDLIDLAVLIPLDPLTGYVSTTGDLIVGAVVAFLDALAIGKDSLINKLWSPVDLSGDAATSSSGLTQAQLDTFSDTYNATGLYQARKDNMVLTAPTAAASATFNVADADNYAIGDKIAVVLDNGDYLYTAITNLVGLVITAANAVPGGRTAPAAALVYVNGDVAMEFNEAATATAADIHEDLS